MDGMEEIIYWPFGLVWFWLWVCTYVEAESCDAVRVCIIYR